MNPKGTRAIALVLALLWAVYWTYFAAASSLSQGWPGALLAIVVATVVFLGSALVAWRSTLLGGVLLLEGLLVCAGYLSGLLGASPADWMVFVLLTLAAPAVVSGLLLLGSWWWTRRPKTA
jgi:hypothetical protein